MYGEKKRGTCDPVLPGTPQRVCNSLSSSSRSSLWLGGQSVSAALGISSAAGSGCIARTNFPTVLWFSSSDEDGGEDFSNTWMVQGMEIFQRNLSAALGALASSIKKRGAHRGVLPCAPNSLSPDSLFFLRQFL